MFRKKDVFYTFFIFIIAFLLTGDLFFRDAQPATFDGRTHITQTAQYYTALSQGQFPVTWADGFANYGMPIPLMAQQTTTYIGAFLTFITNNVLLSYNLVYFVGAFLSAIFFYRFLRFYVNPDLAFLGAFIFNFSSYRIINIYIRGALPEFFAAVFIPLSLIAVYLLSKQKVKSGLGLLIFSTAMTIFTHPFMFVISAFLIIPYMIFLLLRMQNKKIFALLALLGYGTGITITAIYLTPLLLEIKYFYYGQSANHFAPNQFLGLANYFDPNWYYYFKNDVFVRGNFIQFGLVETIIILLGLIFSVVAIVKKKIYENSLLLFFSTIALLIIFLTTAYSEVLYRSLATLGNIQHPWRFLNLLLFIPPIIIVLLLKNWKYQQIAIIILVCTLSFMRFPELYGKNFTVYSPQWYFFTTENTHGVVLNTVWTSKTDDYPVKKEKPAVIEGEGSIIKQEVHNGTRKYTIKAETPIRMIDYTFYFPGWKVYDNGQDIPIEYQDPKYRGIITYKLSQGDHEVKLQFEPTKTRLLGVAITVLGFFFVILIYGLIQYSSPVQKLLQAKPFKRLKKTRND